MFNRKIYAFVAGLSLATVMGCQNPAQQLSANSADPADANLAPVDSNQQQSYPAAGQPVYRQPYKPVPTRVLGQAQSYPQQEQGKEYQQPAPIERSQPAGAPDPSSYIPPNNYDHSAYQQQADDGNVDDEYLAEQASQPPPPLPVYEQPPCPEPNYIWTPGYWSYAPAGYFWVPGAWVAAPYQGALWTPGYWGGYGNGYRFHRGFWGLHIGFYGGINYGFGYIGSGYHGGYWNGNSFFYNRAVNRVNETVIRNVYVRNVTINNTVINNTVINDRVSYNGGRGGIQARPAAYEIAAMHEQHAPPMTTQVQLHQQAQQNRLQFYDVNHGRPPLQAAQHPLVADRGVPPPPRPRAQAPAPGGFSNRPANTQPGIDQHSQPQQLQPRPMQPVDQQRTQPMQPQQALRTQQQRTNPQQDQQQIRGDQRTPYIAQPDPRAQHTPQPASSTLQARPIQPRPTIIPERAVDQQQHTQPLQQQQVQQQHNAETERQHGEQMQQAAQQRALQQLQQRNAQQSQDQQRLQQQQRNQQVQQQRSTLPPQDLQHRTPQAAPAPAPQSQQRQAPQQSQPQRTAPQPAPQPRSEPPARAPDSPRR